jgi:hypothetical protein
MKKLSLFWRIRIFLVINPIFCVNLIVVGLFFILNNNCFYIEAVNRTHVEHIFFYQPELKPLVGKVLNLLTHEERSLLSRWYVIEENKLTPKITLIPFDLSVDLTIIDGVIAYTAPEKKQELFNELAYNQRNFLILTLVFFSAAFFIPYAGKITLFATALEELNTPMLSSETDVLDSYPGYEWNNVFVSLDGISRINFDFLTFATEIPADEVNREFCLQCWHLWNQIGGLSALHKVDLIEEYDSSWFYMHRQLDYCPDYLFHHDVLEDLPAEFFYKFETYNKKKFYEKFYEFSDFSIHFRLP